MVTIDDLKKLERHLNEVQIANFDGNASMAQMVTAQHEALIRILDYLVQERMIQALQDTAKPVSDTCKQIIGEIEKIKEAMPLSDDIERKAMIKALQKCGENTCVMDIVEYREWIAAAITRLENGGDL